jgi:hypothetical protein
MGNAKYATTRLTMSIGVAVLSVMAAVVLVTTSTVSPAVKLSADSTALFVCGTGCPTFHDADIEIIMNQFITPTHPRQTITPVAVTTPAEAWPLTGVLRLLGLAVGDPRLFGPGGAGWPDEPWWKLSGLFDLTGDQSIQAGVADLEAAMAAHGNDQLVIYGYSQGAVVVVKEMRKLAEQYPVGTDAPNISFVLGGSVGVPNGGLGARFPGLHIPILEWTYDGPDPTDTQFHTDVITRQYDGFADFPLYPLNVIADLNAVLGAFYVHTWPFDVSLPADPTTSPAYQGTYGETSDGRGGTSYYFFQNPDLPLFGPLRTLGVPEALIDVVEPFFRVIVALGYDRSIPPWEPTPARLIPTLNPPKVTADLVNAIGEGINNALAHVGLPPLLRIPAPVTLRAPATETATADIFRQVTSTDTPTQTEQATVDGNGDQTQQVTVDGNGDRNPAGDVDGNGDQTHRVTVDGNGDRNPAGDVDGNGDQTHRVTSAHTPTRIQQVSSTAGSAVEPSTPTTPEPSVSASTPKPAKTRPVVRDSLGVGQRLPDRSHRGEGDQPTTRTAAAGAGAATGARSSAASSSAASSSTGSSSGGDGHGS